MAAWEGAGPAADHGTVRTDSWGLHQFPAVPTAPGPSLRHASRTRPPDTPPGRAGGTRRRDAQAEPQLRGRVSNRSHALSSPSLFWKTVIFL